MEATGRTQLKELEGQIQALYDRVVAGDPVAPAELTVLVWETYASRGTLINVLKSGGGAHEEVKEELVSFVAEYAAKLVAAIIAGTSTYDPDKSPLAAYIQMELRFDLLTEADKRRTHKERNAQKADVGDEADRWNFQPTTEELVIGDLELTQEQIQGAQGFIDSLSPAERICLDLMADEVRETEPYAEKLGLTHLPVKQQAEEVNKIKERLTKRMKRLR